MRQNRVTAVVVAVLASVLAPPLVAVAPASGADTSLPIAGFSDVLVDEAHGHVFITGGSGSSAVVVTDLDGNVLDPIPDAHGAQQLLLSQDGTAVYVALGQGDGVGVIDTTTLAMTKISTGPSTCPYDVAETAGRIWYSYGCGQWQGAIGFIDTEDSDTVHPAVRTGFYSAPQLESSAALPGQVAFANRGISSGGLFLATVTEGDTVTLPTRLTIDADVRDMAITPDGTRVITTSMAPYIHPVYLTSDGSADGSYDTSAYPNAVAVRQDGMVAAGIQGSYDPDVYVYESGSRALFRSYDFGYSEPILAAGGLAFGDTRLYAILQTDWYTDATYALRVITPRGSSDLSVTASADTYAYGDTAELTVHLAGADGDDEVSVFARPRGGKETLLTTGVLDGEGDLTASTVVRRRTTFRVEYAGDSTHEPAAAETTVAVRALVTAALRGWSERSGSYYLYPSDRDARIVGAVAPNHFQDCLHFRAQFFSGHWRRLATTDCVSLSVRSRASADLAGDGLVGVRLRVRAEWTGDDVNAAARSDWRYLKFVR